MLNIINAKISSIQGVLSEYSSGERKVHPVLIGSAVVGLMTFATIKVAQSSIRAAYPERKASYDKAQKQKSLLHEKYSPKKLHRNANGDAEYDVIIIGSGMSG